MTVNPKIEEFFNDENIQDNPFTRKEPRIALEWVASPMPRRAVQHLFSLLGDMHACYSYLELGECKTLEEAECIIDYMHEFLDEAMDTVRYSTFKGYDGGHERDNYEDEQSRPVPDWLKPDDDEAQ